MTILTHTSTISLCVYPVTFLRRIFILSFLPMTIVISKWLWLVFIVTNIFFPVSHFHFFTVVSIHPSLLTSSHERNFFLETFCSVFGIWKLKFYLNFCLCFCKKTLLRKTYWGKLSYRVFVKPFFQRMLFLHFFVQSTQKETKHSKTEERKMIRYYK